MHQTFYQKNSEYTHYKKHGPVDFNWKQSQTLTFMGHAERCGWTSRYSPSLQAILYTKILAFYLEKLTNSILPEPEGSSPHS
jgi:hypothetical protein